MRPFPMRDMDIQSVQISVIGGRMRREDLLDYMTQAETENLVLPPPFRAAQIEVNSVDANGGIVDFNITDPWLWLMPNKSKLLYPEVVDTERRLWPLFPVDSDLRLLTPKSSFGFIPLDGLDTLRLEWKKCIP